MASGSRLFRTSDSFDALVRSRGGLRRNASRLLGSDATGAGWLVTVLRWTSWGKQMVARRRISLVSGLLFLALLSFDIDQSACRFEQHALVLSYFNNNTKTSPKTKQKQKLHDTVTYDSFSITTWILVHHGEQYYDSLSLPSNTLSRVPYPSLLCDSAGTQLQSCFPGPLRLAVSHSLIGRSFV
jgi:hypothetical protein